MIYIFSSLGYTPKWGIAGFYGAFQVAQPIYQYKRHKRCGLNTWVRKIPWRRVQQLIPVFLPGESHGWRRLHGGLQSLDHRVRQNWSILAHSTHGNSLYLTFWEMVKLFFLKLHHFIFLQALCEELWFLYIFTNTCYYMSFFNHSWPSVCEVVFICISLWFSFVFPW